MEKFLKAALQAWNPIGETRRRLEEETLTVSDVLVPAITAIIAFDLFRMAGYKFFVNGLAHGLGQEAPKMETQFIVELGAMVGNLVPVAAISVLPLALFEPFGKNAVAAAVLLLASATAFYSASVGAVGFFVAGAQAWESPELGTATFIAVNFLLSTIEIGLGLYFWIRIGRTVLQLSKASFAGITIAAVMGLAFLFVLLIGAMSIQS